MIEVDLRLDRGAFRLSCAFRSDSGALALFGRSGSGKSTVLGLIAGLLRPDAGRVVLDGETLVDVERGIFVPPHRRRVGVVFQDALLFPHLSVRTNLDYGRRFARAGRPVDADAVIAMLGIGHLMDRRPAGLSGGERQRVAIGRALLAGPRLLLLDEPLSALDFERRREIMPYVERLRDALDWPLVYVSHAVDEVARIAREVVVLEDGAVVARGAPGDVLAPGGAAAGFGAVSVIEARVAGYDADYGLSALSHPAGSISVPGNVGPPGSVYRVLVRATDVALAVQRPRDVSFRTVLTGTIRAITTEDGPTARVELALRGEGRLVALVTRKAIDELGLDTGDEVFAMLKATALDERATAYAPRVR
ncbi:MAG: molybdenum ABC transporter ATP-binding protein [Burkholderiales bacterium]|nr:MAG: molybdenum ABC transporter ATP-binding protein [Burkholderiales bacterium]